MVRVTPKTIDLFIGLRPGTDPQEVTHALENDLSNVDFTFLEPRPTSLRLVLSGRDYQEIFRGAIEKRPSGQYASYQKPTIPPRYGQLIDAIEWITVSDLSVIEYIAQKNAMERFVARSRRIRCGHL